VGIEEIDRFVGEQDIVRRRGNTRCGIAGSLIVKGDDV